MPFVLARRPTWKVAGISTSFKDGLGQVSRLLEREENLLTAFSFFDKDGSGYITIDELQQACKEFGLSELNLDEMIREIDQDNDGHIDYAEFAAMMRKGNAGAVGRRTMRKTINLGQALGLVGIQEDE